MKRLISLVLITVMLLTTVYADIVSQLGETVKEEHDKNYHITSIRYRFITHAQGKTYVVYSKYNEIGDQYFYLATLDGDKLNTIGEIDEMIGGNNEPTTYYVVGMPQYEADHFYVMGMVQIDGTVYIAKKRHIYKLVGNELHKLELKYDGKPWDTERLNGATVIGKMVTNGDALFVTMDAVGTYLTADSEDALATPLDGQVLRIDNDGNVTFTYTRLATHFMYAENSWANKHVDFAVNQNEDRLVFERDIYGTERLHTVELGETKPDMLKSGVEDRYAYCENKVMYISNELYSYKTVAHSRYINDNTVDIIRITLKERIPYRDTRVYNAAWICTTTKVATIDKASSISSWSLGDDGCIYLVLNGHEGSDGKGTAGYRLYKVKP